jgi:hypothetical protein
VFNCPTPGGLERKQRIQFSIRETKNHECSPAKTEKRKRSRWTSGDNGKNITSFGAGVVGDTGAAESSGRVKGSASGLTGGSDLDSSSRLRETWVDLVLV